MPSRRNLPRCLPSTLPTDTTAVPPPLSSEPNKAKQNPNHRGDEEYNYFMAVCFPANQLTIIDYNPPCVKDLNGLSPEQFLEAVEKNFTVEEKGTEIYKPQSLHNFSLYPERQMVQLDG